jgi:two-component system, chemotaxis family, protein-glutamate methylesterase/glutaminase
MAKIRVLVVDDSVVMRRMVSDVINGDPALEVVGIAPNGRLAVDRVKQLNPDVVTMDVEMPEMDGVQAVKELRKLNRRLPIVMFSSLTERSAATTIDALAAGASDYVAKPANLGSATAATARMREELLPKIKTLCGLVNFNSELRSGNSESSQNLTAKVRSLRARVVSQPISIVTIGVSIGGPNALAEVIPAIPADFPVPIVIVQHMPPVFTRLLADRLNVNSAITVREAVAGEELRPGAGWIAQGDHHLVLEKIGTKTRLKLTRDPPENSCRPAADPLFRSAAQLYGRSVLAVVLTGMGQDGLNGCEHVAAAGGQILVQDEASSVVWGMPGFVARAGLADRVLPLSQIAGEIMRLSWVGRARPGAFVGNSG